MTDQFSGQYIEDVFPDVFDGVPMSTKGTYDRNQLLARFDQREVKSFQGRGGMQLSYIAHPTIRRRLIDYGGDWSMQISEPQVLGGAFVVTGHMTINGATRPGVGTEPVPSNPAMVADAIKMAESDCLKRCAMAHGIGLELWEGEEEDYKAQAPVYTPGPLTQQVQQASRPQGSYNNGGGHGYSQPRQAAPSSNADPDGVTTSQVNFAKSLLQERGYVSDDGHTDLTPADNLTRQMFRKNFADTTKREASQVIDRIKMLQPNGVQI